MANVRVPTGVLAELYEIAINTALDDPLGRAVYAMNRRVNAGRLYRLKDGVFTWLTDLDVMIRAHPETALKWRLHWEAGGSVKSLGKMATRIVTRWEPDAVVEPRGRRAISFEEI